MRQKYTLLLIACCRKWFFCSLCVQNEALAIYRTPALAWKRFYSFLGFSPGMGGAAAFPQRGAKALVPENRKKLPLPALVFEKRKRPFSEHRFFPKTRNPAVCVFGLLSAPQKDGHSHGSEDTPRSRTGGPSHAAPHEVQPIAGAQPHSAGACGRVAGKSTDA